MIRRRLITATAAAVVLASACSGSATSTAPPPAPRPTSSVRVSNEVPTVQELMDTGLSQEQAECFIRTMDPNDTGVITDASLFTQAFGECV